ncbi:MAG: serine protease [Pseudomonadota bacterium]
MFRRHLKAAVVTGLALTAAATGHAQQSFTCRDDTGRTVSRIVGGNEIQHADAPYQVFLQIEAEDGQSAFGCGGSLISRSFVLTAAHCVMGDELDSRTATASPDQVLVAYGGDNIGEMFQTGLVARVEEIIIHDRYDYKRVASPADIAVLRLSEPVDVPDSAIMTMASARMEQALMTDFTCARVTGYGVTDSGSSSDIMRFVNLYIRPTKDCRDFSREFTGEMICAGYREGDQNSCNGDSGGPLVIREGPTGWVQVGVVSWGRKGCKGTGAFGVYTKVSSFVPWIVEVTSR